MWRPRDPELMIGQVSPRLLPLVAAAVRGEGFAPLLAAAAEVAEELAGERPAACAAGCDYCCVLNVAVLLPEAAVIADRLKEHVPPVELAVMQQRLASQALRVRWMEDSERIHRRVSCPFLDSSGCCGIYPVRPLACRSLTSLERDACCVALDSSLSDQAVAVPVDGFRQSVFDGVFCALADALEQHGIMNRSIELSAGVAAFLAKPELLHDLVQGRRLPERLWE
ncbi:YkgJ family cysteine cluster protein [Trichlorobacter ammonificans]|uniref:YkgJ family cysteine cluster protein n=1 Tax=Trichlorobacter ammonificans TaxID=2916410 RepID=A0ABM9D6N8_9BACT|nr:YkgJ family cysteine cluster protein [Trichlorobacter ammonificans]CAH2030842.1 conserved protein of unknown function [Trichlorobacter ammonificans]